MENNSFVNKLKNFDIKKNIKVVIFAVLAVVLVVALVVTTLFLSSGNTTSTNTKAGTSDEATLVWTPVSATAASGATFTANIKMRFIAPHTVQGYQIKLNFDNTKLTATNIIYKGSASYVNGISDANDTTNGYTTLSRVNTKGYMLLFGAVSGNGWDIDPAVDGDVLILSLTFASKSSAQSQLLVDPSTSPSIQAKVIFAQTVGTSTTFPEAPFVVDQPFTVNPGAATTAPVTTTVATTAPATTTPVPTTVNTTTPVATTVKTTTPAATTSPVATTVKTTTPIATTVKTTTPAPTNPTQSSAPGSTTIRQTTVITQTSFVGTTSIFQSSTPTFTDTSIPDTTTPTNTTVVETTTETETVTPAATTASSVPDAVLWLIILLLITIPAIAIATVIIWILKRKPTTPPTTPTPPTSVPPMPPVPTV